MALLDQYFLREDNLYDGHYDDECRKVQKIVPFITIEIGRTKARVMDNDL